MLTLGRTKKCYVAQKIVVSTKKKSQIEISFAHQNYVSHNNICCGKKKNYVTPKRRLMLLDMFSVAQKRNIYKKWFLLYVNTCCID